MGAGAPICVIDSHCYICGISVICGRFHTLNLSSWKKFRRFFFLPQIKPKTVIRPFLLSSSHISMGTFVFVVYVVFQQNNQTFLFFKTTETIQDNINDRDNFSVLRPISSINTTFFHAFSYYMMFDFDKICMISAT